MTRNQIEEIRRRLETGIRWGKQAEYIRQSRKDIAVLLLEIQRLKERLGEGK